MIRLVAFPLGLLLFGLALLVMLPALVREKVPLKMYPAAVMWAMLEGHR